MAKKNYGRTRAGEPITDELVETLAAKAEEGFDVDEVLRRRGGRPAMGSFAASVEYVRLDPELGEALRERADRDGRTSSDVIRDALRRYLQGELNRPVNPWPGWCGTYSRPVACGTAIITTCPRATGEPIAPPSIRPSRGLLVLRPPTGTSDTLA